MALIDFSLQCLACGNWVALCAEEAQADRAIDDWLDGTDYRCDACRAMPAA